LNFLADESCDFRVVRALREAGHEVLAVCEFAKSAIERNAGKPGVPWKQVKKELDVD